MSMSKSSFAHTVPSTTLGDLLERILDKGIVVSGDIKIKLVEVERLTIQIRLVVCSVDRAKEIGIDWWRSDPHLSGVGDNTVSERLIELERRLKHLEGNVPVETDHG